MDNPNPTRILFWPPELEADMQAVEPVVYAQVLKGAHELLSILDADSVVTLFMPNVGARKGDDRRVASVLAVPASPHDDDFEKLCRAAASAVGIDFQGFVNPFKGASFFAQGTPPYPWGRSMPGVGSTSLYGFDAAARQSDEYDAAHYINLQRLLDAYVAEVGTREHTGLEGKGISELRDMLGSVVAIGSYEVAIDIIAELVRKGVDMHCRSCTADEPCVVNMILEAARQVYNLDAAPYLFPLRAQMGRQSLTGYEDTPTEVLVQLYNDADPDEIERAVLVAIMAELLRRGFDLECAVCAFDDPSCVINQLVAEARAQYDIGSDSMAEDDSGFGFEPEPEAAEPPVPSLTGAEAAELIKASDEELRAKMADMVTRDRLGRRVGRGILWLLKLLIVRPISWLFYQLIIKGILFPIGARQGDPTYRMGWIAGMRPWWWFIITWSRAIWRFFGKQIGMPYRWHFGDPDITLFDLPMWQQDVADAVYQRYRKLRYGWHDLWDNSRPAVALRRFRSWWPWAMVNGTFVFAWVVDRIKAFFGMFGDLLDEWIANAYRKGEHSGPITGRNAFWSVFGTVGALIAVWYFAAAGAIIAGWHYHLIAYVCSITAFFYLGRRARRAPISRAYYEQREERFMRNRMRDVGDHLAHVMRGMGLRVAVLDASGDSQDWMDQLRDIL